MDVRRVSPKRRVLTPLQQVPAVSTDEVKSRHVQPIQECSPRKSMMHFRTLLHFLAFSASLLGMGVLPGRAEANSGSASISHWRVTYSSTSALDSAVTSVWVSNTSNSDVVITLRLRDQDGHWQGDTGFIPTISTGGFSSCNTLQNVCTLQAGKSAYFSVTGTYTSSFTSRGYGKIEWTSAGTDVEQVAILVDGMVSYQNQGVWSRVPLLITRGPF